MTTMLLEDVGKNLGAILRDDLGEPLLIQGDSRNAVLVAEDQWSAPRETLYLMSIPGMADSIVEGLNTPISECSEELGW